MYHISEQIGVMEYSISPESMGQYVTIRIKGDFRISDAMQIMTEAFDAGEELGIRQYLLDVTEAVHSWPLGQDYTFIHHLRNQGKFDRVARTAVLVALEDNSHDFIITVSMNAGLNIRLFRDKEQALAFLTNTALAR